jgi:hypothetical protein
MKMGQSMRLTIQLHHGVSDPTVRPSVAPMAAFAAAFLIACIGVGMMVMWWLTTLALAVLVFVAVERGQFRTRRPKASLLRPSGTA